MAFTSADRAAYLSRGEEIKLIISGLVLLVGLGVIFGPSAKPDPKGDPEIALPQPQVVDAKVALDRFKAQLEVTPDSAPPTPTEPQQEYVPDPEVLTQVEDFVLNEVESEAMYELIAQLHSMSEEALRKAPETHGTFSYADLKTEQGRFQARGKFLTLRGRFVGPLSQWVLAKYPNDANLGWVWQGLFRVGRQGYWVSLTDKTFEPQVGNYGTPIELTVAFCNGYSYDTEMGMVRSVPHVIAKSMIKIDNPPPEAFYPWEIAYMALAVISAALLFVVGYALYTRRERKKFDAWQRDRRQKRMHKAVAPGGKAEKAGAAAAATDAGAAAAAATEAGAETDAATETDADTDAATDADADTDAATDADTDADTDAATDADADTDAATDADTDAATDAETDAAADADADAATDAAADAGTDAAADAAADAEADAETDASTDADAARDAP